MSDFKSKIAIIVVSIILGIILSIQLKTLKKDSLNSHFPLQRNKELAAELNKLQEENNKLVNQANNLEDKIRKYESNVSEESDYINELSKELLKYRMFSGYEKLYGPGIVLSIDDPEGEVIYGEDTSFLVRNYQYLLQIISYLNATEAEAISINGLRYTAYSEFLRVDEHLSINGVSVTPPFEIKAIGDPDKLESALNLKGGIIYKLKNSYDMDIKINRKKSVNIPKYTKKKEFRYAEPATNSTNP
ncbi:MAG: DUF881 domain-containing protein [Firmicutes bacterium]|nr:DUF881 domain-containing protein [Bacillota bacterium]